MKNIYKILIFSLLTNISLAQSNIKLDTILGENGIFKRFKPKEISDGQILNFNIKISFSGNDKQGKPVNGSLFVNSKYGYVGISQSKDFVFDANAKKFTLMVYSNSMQNFTFRTDNKGRKMVMSMPFNPESKKQNIDIKKNNLTPKTLEQFNLKSFAYSNENSTTNGLRYFTDSNLSNSSKFSNQLAYAGLGFYQIGNKTILCTSLEMGNSNFTIDKIEAANVSINSSDFKKDVSPISSDMVQEMMKRLKKH